jgi:hypothetical protein
MPDTSGLVEDVRSLIQKARRDVAVAVNAELTLLYWHSESGSVTSSFKANGPTTARRLSPRWGDN